MPTEAEDRGGASRGALASAAREVFATSGYVGASTRAIASSAGVDVALIRYHFGGKRSLYIGGDGAATAFIYGEYLGELDIHLGELAQ